VDVINNLELVSAESVHFADGDEVEAIRERLLETSHLYEVGERIDSEEDLMRALAATMPFPDYFGANWDALDESLSELEPEARRGVVLLVRHAADLWQRLPRTAAQLVETWLGAVELWRERGVPFHLVFVW
jgi:RNAse (barnase) inhibitor barstar